MRARVHSPGQTKQTVKHINLAFWEDRSSSLVLASKPGCLDIIRLSHVRSNPRRLTSRRLLFSHGSGSTCDLTDMFTERGPAYFHCQPARLIKTFSGVGLSEILRDDAKW